MAGSNNVGATYSWTTACIYVFNLVVGVGGLFLPQAFQDAGLILATLFLLMVAFFGLITASWVVEVQACANAMLDLNKENNGDGDGDGGGHSRYSMSNLLARDEEDTQGLLGNEDGFDNDDEEDGFLARGATKEQLRNRVSAHADNEDSFPLLATDDDYDIADIGSEEEEVVGEAKTLFHLQNRVEMGRMAEIFLGPVGKVIFYLFLVLYLYGDLAIYAVYVAQSITQVAAEHHIGETSQFPILESYQLWFVLFALVVCPFAYFDFQKTKYLQFVTMVARNGAFLLMIVLALITLYQGHGASFADITWFRICGLSGLFGSCIYAFMCHHSIPGFITPIDRKRSLTGLFVVDYAAIFTTYIVFTWTANMAYGNQCIETKYTTNFMVVNDPPPGWIVDLLSLFPVFTVSTNFPLIAITLRNNLIRLLPLPITSPFWSNFAYSSIAIFPPLVLAFFYQDVGSLVSITGSYPALGIMFLMPLALEFFARRKIRHTFGLVRNPHRSPFRSKWWMLLILLWSCVALAFTVWSQGKAVYEWATDSTSGTCGCPLSS